MKSHISLRMLFLCTGRFDRSRTFCADVRYVRAGGSRVDLLCNAGLNARYGKNETANELDYRIQRAQLADFVENTPVVWRWKQRALLHAQSGISSDIGTTPGVLPYGDGPYLLAFCKRRTAPAFLSCRDQRHSDAGRNHQA